MMAIAFGATMRRSVFATVLCFMALGGIVPAFASDSEDRVSPMLEFAFEEIVELAPAVRVGRTPRGERQFVRILGGKFEGPKIRGNILPGGWDWQLLRADGCTDIQADYMIQADDGTVINVNNRGSLCPGKRPGEFEVKTLATFEAPFGAHDWVNQSAFVGTLDPVTGKNAVRIRFYRVRE